MQIWQEVSEGDYTAREIGGHVFVRQAVAEDHSIPFDAPREWFDERIRAGGEIACGMMTIPRTTMMSLIGALDAGRPELIKRASREAAVTQNQIEVENRQDPTDALKIIS